MERQIQILLVEDEIIPAMLMERQLGQMGYGVLGLVTTGEKAVSRVREDGPDIVIMDIQLAGAMDGITAAAAILESRPMPVIFVTGYDDPAIQKRARTLGPLAYLIKPLDVAQVEAIIRGHFAGRTE